jgi:hypothetical protein
MPTHCIIKMGPFHLTLITAPISMQGAYFGKVGTKLNSLVVSFGWHPTTTCKGQHEAIDLWTRAGRPLSDALLDQRCSTWRRCAPSGLGMPSSVVRTTDWEEEPVEPRFGKMKGTRIS